MTVKKSFIFVLLLLFCILSGCQNKETSISAPDAKGQFSFTVLKAGQADAIIMKTQSHSVIIDLGEADDGDEISELLKENAVSDVIIFLSPITTKTI